MRAPGIFPDGTFALRPPDVVASVLLSTSPQAVVVPTNAKYVFFAAEVSFAVAYGSSVGAAVAALTTASSSGAELNPTVRSLGGIGELSLIGRSSGYLSASFYSKSST